MLNTDGAAALARAKDRFDQFGQQSEQISKISREARAQVELLEKQADQSKQNANDANEKASKAYELARNALSQQQQIRYRTIIGFSRNVFLFSMHFISLVMNCVRTSVPKSKSQKLHWKMPLDYQMMRCNRPTKSMMKHWHWLQTSTHYRCPTSIWKNYERMPSRQFKRYGFECNKYQIFVYELYFVFQSQQQ